jgi:hypothetical protein
LSAIEPVITYYWKLGYRFSVGDDAKAATRVSNLLKAQKANEKEEAKRAYEDVLIHHTEGILKDDGRSREQKLSVEKDNGIIMKFMLREPEPEPEPQSKKRKLGEVGGGKRKGTKRKGKKTKRRRAKQTRRRRTATKTI